MFDSLAPIYLFAATRWEVSQHLYQIPNTSVILTGIGMRNAYKVASNLRSMVSAADTRPRLPDGGQVPACGQ